MARIFKCLNLHGEDRKKYRVTFTQFHSSIMHRISSSTNSDYSQFSRYYLDTCITIVLVTVNPLTPNDSYSRRTALLTSKRCILYIYSTNTGTEYFKHGIYSPFFSV